MALEQKLRLKLSQRLVMTPSLQQAIKLLQLSRIELEETLTQEILENPVLDVDQQEPGIAGEEEGSSPAVESDQTPEGEDSLPSEAETYNDIDVEAFFADYLADSRSEGPSMAARAPEDAVALENTLSSESGLYDHLVWQLHLVDCAPELVPVCEYIIGNLDESGLLEVDDSEIAEDTGASADQLAEALAIVQSLDPPGIGARTLQECLLLQIDRLDDEGSDLDEGEALELARVVVASHWDALLHQKWDAIAEAVGCDVNGLRPVLDIVHRLELKPGRLYGPDTNTYIEPDVHVKKVDGEFIISLNDDGLPRLRFNPRYSAMLSGNGVDPSVGSYLRDKMKSAMWLIKSIDQRQRTIYKVAQSIVTFQRPFLEYGIEHLKPMVLRQVAEDIGMHESTISRVVSNKYMHTPRGLFPMKFFFHSGVDSAQGGNVSSLVVKERIRKLVEAEDPERPLSDSKIMKMLQREGVRLARRTVAKYREELGIPSSDKRKRAF